MLLKFFWGNLIVVSFFIYNILDAEFSCAVNNSNSDQGSDQQ